MDLHRMRYFLVVAEELHFKRAAARLRITPSPLSKQIKAFERQMGGPLFVRHYHEVTLTPLGEALVGPVREIVQRADALRAIAEQSRGQPCALRVGASALIPSAYLDDFTEAMAKAEPDARVRLGATSAELEEQLVAGALDLALTYLPAGSLRLEWQPWASYPLGVAMRAGDPLAATDDVEPADLARRTVIVGGLPTATGPDDPLAGQLAALGVRDVRHPGGPAALDAQVAAHVRYEGHLALADLVPGSASGRLFAPPQFVIRPIAGEPLRLDVALAWCQGQPATNARLRRALALLGRDRGRLARAEPGAA